MVVKTNFGTIKDLEEIIEKADIHFTGEVVEVGMDEDTEYIKNLPCGCIEDTLNGYAEKLCPKHQEEFDAWVVRQQSTYCP
jgi:hypothetical protein